MSAHAGVCVLIMVIVITEGAPDTLSSWMRMPQLQTQTLHGLMVSIDERLQARLDSLESTIRRLDSTVQDRLDKLERNLNSKELKDELTVEKLTHKIRDVMDSSYDRYNRRLGLTEEKLEMAFNKMQMTTEASLNRLEKQQEDVQNEVMDAVSLLEDIKTQSSMTEDKLNNTHRAIQQHIQRLISPSQEELQKISGSLEHLGSRLNGSMAPASVWSQNDGPPANDVITSMRKEIGLEGARIINKINNMYNELWWRVEALVKELNRVTNATQRDVLEEVRSLVQPDNREFPGDSQENFLEVALDVLERKLKHRLLELGRKVEDRLDTLSAAQNLVMDSCFDGGICHGLESRLSQVLEKIFDVFSGRIEGFSNRTLDLDGLVMEMMELVKSQHSQLFRTVSHNTNMVVTLAEESSAQSKLLHHSVTQLAEKTDNNFQELQDEIQEISKSSGKICADNDKTNEEIVDKILKNITDDKQVILSTSETTMSLLNVTEPKDKTVKYHDPGILKITTDDIGPLADNSSVASASMFKPVIIKPSQPLTLDSSILQVIELMSSNLTQNQKDTLLQILNSTISLDNLEAVIQNTEADPEDDISVEIYDSEALNKTDIDDELSTAGNNQVITTFPDISAETEHIADENSDDLIQNEASTIEVVTITNGTIQTSNETEEKLNHKLDIKSPGITEDLKTQLKYYALIMKIKEGNLNISEYWKPFQQVSNMTGVQNQQDLLPSIEKLCYGEENMPSSEYKNSKMRDRLLLMNQIIIDKNLYEKIENVCNTMTESRITDNTIIEEIVQND